jgi:hypothetical protein
VGLYRVEWLTLLCIREGPGSNLCPGDLLRLLSFFVVFLSPSRLVSAEYLKLGHDRFLPNPLPFIICLSPYHRRCRLYIVYVLKERRNMLGKTPEDDS